VSDQNDHLGLSSEAGSVSGRSHSRRARIVAAAVVATGLIAAGGVAAASGVLSTGDVIPPNDQSIPPDRRLAVEETVLATGTAPVAGPWQMTAYKSEQSAGQPAGLPCVRLVLTDPPEGTPLIGSGFCGEVGDDFGAASLPAINEVGDGQLLVFGITPTGTDRIELESPGAQAVQASVRDGGPSFTRGDVFVMALESDADQGELTAVSDDGTKSAKKIDAEGFFDRMQAFEQLKD
jgi:hypothetical protein